MTYETLAQFCSRDFSRISLLVPILIGDWLYATDGKVCVRAQGVALPEGFGKQPPEGMSQWPEPDVDVCRRLEAIFEGAPPAYRRVLNLPNQNPELQCEYCMGDAGFACEACDHENECSICDGVGKRRKDIYIDAGGVCFSLNSLFRVCGLPRFEICLNPTDPLGHQRFRWDGGEGLVMPLKRQPGMEYLSVDMFASPAQEPR